MATVPRIAFATIVSLLAMSPIAVAQRSATGFAGALEHRVLATSKTSTMERELNQAAESGFRFQAVMGGESAFGGSEVIVVMTRVAEEKGRYAYKLLATSKTSTMQKELQAAADAGFQYKGQTVFQSAFGGAEVVVILERDKEDAENRYEYRLIATSKTATLEKELRETGDAGFDVVGLTVSNTAFGGSELVAIGRRARR